MNDASRYAILIGAEGYQFATPLFFIRNDVMELGDTLENRGGYQVWRFVDSRPGCEWHPTRENVMGRLPELLQQVRASDQLLLYFSGHGFVDDAGKLYLAPIDCDPRRAAETGVPVEWLREQLEACRADFKLLVIDSCHAGTAKGDAESESCGTLAGVSAKDLARPFERTTGVYTLASSRGEEKSLIWDTKRQSLFTYWLNQGLRGHADRDGDGQVTADELFRYVSENVPRVAESVFDRQQNPDRLVGFNVSSHSTVISPEPHTLRGLLDDMAEQLATLMQLQQLEVVGVPEFTVHAEDGELVLGADFGVFGGYCATELEGRLSARSAGRFRVVAREALQQRLRTRGIPVTHLRTPAIEGLSLGADDLSACGSRDPTVEQTPVSALARGILRSRNGRVVTIQCDLIGTNDQTVYGIAGGVALLTEDEWAMLARSVEVRPEDRVSEVRHRPVEAPIIDRLDARAEDPHPMSDPDFPYRVSLMVDGRQRPATWHGNDCYVPVRAGEVYRIRIELGTQLTEPVMMRLLVDGLNTLPQRVPRKGLFVEQRTMDEDGFPRELETELLPAQPVGLDRARAWWLNPAERRVYGVRGFFANVFQGRYNEFLVADVAELPASRQEYTEQLGLITAAFYKAEAVEKPEEARDSDGIRGAAPEKFTKPGEAGEQPLRTRRGQRPGELLAVVHLRYANPEAIAKLHP